MKSLHASYHFIYVFITITGSIPLLVDYLASRVSSRFNYYHWADTSDGELDSRVSSALLSVLLLLLYRILQILSNEFV